MDILKKLNIIDVPLKIEKTYSKEWDEYYWEVWTDEEDPRPIAHFNGDNAVWLEEGKCFNHAKLFAYSPKLLKEIIIFITEGGNEEDLAEVIEDITSMKLEELAE